MYVSKFYPAILFTNNNTILSNRNPPPTYVVSPIARLVVSLYHLQCLLFTEHLLHIPGIVYLYHPQRFLIAEHSSYHSITQVCFFNTTSQLAVAKMFY
jgi:hypothetical protein